jgi:hypothetical protein
LRVPHDLTGDPTEAPYGPLQPRTATLLTLPISCHHTVRSVAQEAYKTLWVDEPDRAERWRRVGNMDQVFGVGRPLRTFSKQVVAAAVQEMDEMGMPDDDVRQHLDNLAALMLWADGWGFIRWGRRPGVSEGHPDLAS